MTENQSHKQEIMKIVEKGAFASKKFLAFFLTESMLCAMAIVALTKQENLGWPLASLGITNSPATRPSAPTARRRMPRNCHPVLSVRT